MTYSPLVNGFEESASRPEQMLGHSPNALPNRLLGVLLSRVCCLLHCPTDTPDLWSQVLAATGDALGCDTAQLFWSEPMMPTAINHWGKGSLPAVGAIGGLWAQLALPAQSLAEQLWCSQAADLQAQLAHLVEDGVFKVTGISTYAPGDWPTQIVEVYGPSSGRHLLLLPLQQENDCIGVLALLRESDEIQREIGPVESHVVEGHTVERLSTNSCWSTEVLRCVEVVGGQIYLAILRSRVERLFRSRSARDQLTQLPDRLLFNQQLTRSIAIALEKDVMLGVAFLDLDRFKNINDTLGHAAGDCLLKEVAERVKSCLRGYDVVARWGGDEFTLLLCDLRSPEEITSIAERILQRLNAPFYVHSQELYVTASLGIALAPYDGQAEQTLLRNADAAMYQAKARGRNNFQVYFEEINADARTQLNLETDLRKALDNGELFLCYQPQVDLRTGHWIGMDDVTYAIGVLKKFSRFGFQIAMDDFGTGYSSLSVLKHFPLDTIKIDRSFVQDLVDSPSDAAIASTIIALAKGLDFKVLAEGIETPEQMAVLNKMGCDYAQGYWFSRPLTVSQVDEMLANGRFDMAPEPG